MSYELYWNTMKNYLEMQSFVDVMSPRSDIRKVFEIRLIDDGHSWMELVIDNNFNRFINHQ